MMGFKEFLIEEGRMNLDRNQGGYLDHDEAERDHADDTASNLKARRYPPLNHDVIRDSVGIAIKEAMTPR